MTTTSPVPLALWPVGQIAAQRQRAGRYDPTSSAHPAKMFPELARRIITEFSRPGDLVVDPMCGAGTTLVEAAAMGRYAVGVEREPRWAELARANAAYALAGEAAGRVGVYVGDAGPWPRCRDLLGRADLVLTSPPYSADVGVLDRAAWGAGGGLCPARARNYSADRANLGHARGRAYHDAMALVYAGCAGLLQAGGMFVVVTKHTRRTGEPWTWPGSASSWDTAGLAYVGHVIALHAAVRDGPCSPGLRSGRSRPGAYGPRASPCTSRCTRTWSCSAKEDLPVPVELPLSVWDSAERSGPVQRAGATSPCRAPTRPRCSRPSLARGGYLYRPGDLVADPMCGVGTSLVEAVHQGRDAIGVEYEPAWAAYARANLALAAGRVPPGRARWPRATPATSSPP